MILPLCVCLSANLPTPVDVQARKSFCFWELHPWPGALDPAGDSASRPPLDDRSVIHPTFLDLTTPMGPCGWEGNRPRVTDIMVLRLRAQGLEEGDDHPPPLRCLVEHGWLYLTLLPTLCNTTTANVVGGKKWKPGGRGVTSDVVWDRRS